MTIKVWAKRNHTWAPLLQDDVDLRALNWLGTVQNVHFPPNSLVFYMVDGIYSLDLSGKATPSKLPCYRTYLVVQRAHAASRHWSNSIQDALATREVLTQQISELLGREPKNEVPEADDKVALANKYLSQQRHAVAQARNETKTSRPPSQRAAKHLAQGRAAQERVATDVENATEKLTSRKPSWARQNPAFTASAAASPEDLRSHLRHHPHPARPAPLVPNMRPRAPQLNLPSASKSSPPITEDSSPPPSASSPTSPTPCSYYLAVPLPYPIRTFGSRASIRTAIPSCPTPSAVSALCPARRVSAQFRFDYAWFLLNKDIERCARRRG